MTMNRLGKFTIVVMMFLIPALLRAQSSDKPATPREDARIEHDVMIMAAPLTNSGVPPLPALGDAMFDIKSVKGAPYSAETQSETVQKLADGNRIVQRNSTRIYRDSEGRTRQEYDFPGGLAGEKAQLISVTDPVAGVSYTLHPENKTAEKIPFLGADPGMFNLPVPAPGAAGGLRQNQIYIRRKATSESGTRGMPVEAHAGVRIIARGPNSIDQQSAAEDLGKRMMAGVEVDGKRTTTTIPVGQIGNEQPIIITNETWYSPELQIIVYSKRDDPMMGETTYQLEKLSRGEPDPALFRVPSNYAVNEPDVKFFRKSKP